MHLKLEEPVNLPSTRTFPSRGACFVPPVDGGDIGSSFSLGVKSQRLGSRLVSRA